MELSSLIFVALALVWAVVLIPKALRHHDEVAETRSVETLSDGVRVLARREAVGAREARLVLRPEPVVPAQRPASTSAPVASAPADDPRRDGKALLTARRAAAAAAARRRRRVLGVLLTITAGVAGASVAGLLLPWAAAVPAAAVLAFLVVARVTVRRERMRWDALAARRREAGAPSAPAAEPVEAAGEPVSEPVVEPVVEPVGAPAEPVAEPARNEQGLAVVSGLDDTSSIPVGLRDAEPAVGSDRLWDPLPVTLPTYVTKPRATRTVRTIDLGSPGVSSSGRDAAASALVAEAATGAASEGPDSRAVGS